MKKQLSKEMIEEMNRVPKGQLGMPFLSPTDKENFIEEVVGEHKYRIKLEESSLTVEISPKIPGKDLSFKILDGTFETDWHSAKLSGWIMFKILPKYSQ